MEPLETIEVENTRVECDGGGGASGHPRVYLTIGQDRHIDCPYCGCRFVLKEGVSATAGGH